MNLAITLLKNASYLRGKHDLLLSIQKAQTAITKVRKSSSKILQKVAQSMAEVRGRPLFYPAIFSGLGKGPLVELEDGSVKYDFITGIGTHFFGHSDLDLIDVGLQAASQNVVMQGHLQVSSPYLTFSKQLLKLAGPPFKYVWLALSGTMANENALKLIRHKKSPAYKVIAFQNCFHGRSVMMADITDNQGFKKGLYNHKTAYYVPFFNPKDPQRSIRESLETLRSILKDHPSEIAGFIFELVQGEGGFTPAPREFFIPLMELCKTENIAVWVDEVQTVGRTGELFAFQKLNLSQYVDIVTVGKMLQNCATLYREELNPDPGLLAGTFSGSTVSLSVGTRILTRLQKETFFGPNGKISKLETWAKKGLEGLQQKYGESVISEISGVGAMVAFQFRDGNLEQTKKLVLQAFEEGVMLFYCGRGPYKIRFLLPAGCLTQTQYQGGLKYVEKAIQKILK
ncbi:MAG: aminotransferase class III-fold pyridoxal phosphate-dependent enzyme [Deltaproteobacteria bacterium]|nr:aminotransferase class III-fold pyridoxal phosphate-dependent enzyme [Deltaproteobacteria bacterium]